MLSSFKIGIQFLWHIFYVKDKFMKLFNLEFSKLRNSQCRLFLQGNQLWSKIVPWRTVKT